MPDAGVVIRPLTGDHLEQVCAFFREIDQPAYRAHFAPHPFTDAEARRVCGYAGRDLYVGVFMAGGGDGMVGYGMLRGLDEGYEVPSLGLCVLEVFQGRGAGRSLLAYLLKACSDRGAVRAMLKVKRDNPEARGLYESEGFVFRDHDDDFLVGYRALGEADEA